MKINYLGFNLFAALVITSATTQAQNNNKLKDTTIALNRKKIDSIDREMIELLGQREKCVKEIGIYKAKNNIPPLQAARFQEVLDNAIKAGAKENLSPEFITEFLNAVHKESLRIEEDLKSPQ
ncbi:chorismate mutase [Mucilaginibacter sp. E4BP6]|uniref:chorismate mutase n=1 Tax=Mucilaginibacter sp. E4BP6 TaxID=2723089 RepID=UPI0015C7B27D|nr:chorismate mutase [Mucilaginibacter sp. E4BP6]NYE67047.1 chorismate mutase [Mucilaginibacter sp. E4BP6]